MQSGVELKTSQLTESHPWGLPLKDLECDVLAVTSHAQEEQVLHVGAAPCLLLPFGTHSGLIS